MADDGGSPDDRLVEEALHALARRVAKPGDDFVWVNLGQLGNDIKDRQGFVPPGLGVLVASLNYDVRDNMARVPLRWLAEQVVRQLLLDEALKAAAPGQRSVYINMGNVGNTLRDRRIAVEGKLGPFVQSLGYSVNGPYALVFIPPNMGSTLSEAGSSSISSQARVPAERSAPATFGDASAASAAQTVVQVLRDEAQKLAQPGQRSVLVNMGVVGSALRAQHVHINGKLGAFVQSLGYALHTEHAVVPVHGLNKPHTEQGAASVGPVCYQISGQTAAARVSEARGASPFFNETPAQPTQYMSPERLHSTTGTAMVVRKLLHEEAVKLASPGQRIVQVNMGNVGNALRDRGIAVEGKLGLFVQSLGYTIDKAHALVPIDMDPVALDGSANERNGLAATSSVHSDRVEPLTVPHAEHRPSLMLSDTEEEAAVRQLLLDVALARATPKHSRVAIEIGDFDKILKAHHINVDGNLSGFLRSLGYAINMDYVLVPVDGSHSGGTPSNRVQLDQNSTSGAPGSSAVHHQIASAVVTGPSSFRNQTYASVAAAASSYPHQLSSSIAARATSASGPLFSSAEKEASGASSVVAVPQKSSSIKEVDAASLPASREQGATSTVASSFSAGAQSVPLTLALVEIPVAATSPASIHVLDTVEACRMAITELVCDPDVNIVTLDTKSASGRLCLIQIHYRRIRLRQKRTLLIDTTIEQVHNALKDLVNPLLQNARIVKVMHDCREHCRLLADSANCDPPAPIFDTHVGHSSVLAVGQPSMLTSSHGVSLKAFLHQHGAPANQIKDGFAARLEKEPNLWSTRPMPTDMLECARQDVDFLLTAYHAFVATLTENRKHEIMEESARVATAASCSKDVALLTDERLLHRPLLQRQTSDGSDLLINGLPDLRTTMRNQPADRDDISDNISDRGLPLQTKQAVTPVHVAAYGVPEVLVVRSAAAVLYYNSQSKAWVPMAPEARVDLYRHTTNNTYRVVARSTTDQSVVIDSPLYANLEYRRVSGTFHQWQDWRYLYGLTFASEADANVFGIAMENGIRAINAAHFFPPSTVMTPRGARPRPPSAFSVPAPPRPPVVFGAIAPVSAVSYASAGLDTSKYLDWSVDEVCAYLSKMKVDDDAIKYIRKQKIKGKNLAALSDEHLSRFGIEAHGDRSDVLDAIKRLADKTDAPVTAPVSAAINRKDVELGQWLGVGHFGEVFQGTFKGAPVAIKRPLDNNMLDDFQDEVTLMRNITPHPNVVQYFGLCSSPDEILLVVEFCHYGNLEDYLRQHPDIPVMNLLHICSEVAAGMTHLSSFIVHRDISTRNILLDVGPPPFNVRAKVADFGLSRPVAAMYCAGTDKRGYFRHAIPRDWMPNEVVLYNLPHTAASDVWMFVTTIWEMFMGIPTEKGADGQYIKRIPNPDRDRVPPLVKPPRCPNDLYALMTKCWAIDPAHRPTFQMLHIELLRLENTTGYHPM